MKHRSRVNILIVDNNERILWAIQELLENAEFDTTTTWSGREALALLKTGRFDVLLVDDYLPDLHAHDFLERVRCLPIQPRVIVMQPEAPSLTDLQKYESLGAAQVVDKRNQKKIWDAVTACCKADSITIIH